MKLQKKNIQMRWADFNFLTVHTVYLENTQQVRNNYDAKHSAVSDPIFYTTGTTMLQCSFHNIELKIIKLRKYNVT